MISTRTIPDDPLDPNNPTDPYDTNDGNNNNAKGITIFEALDLAVTIPAIPETASGSFFDFQVDVENRGPSTADSYTVTVPIPTGVINITPPSQCQLSGQNYVCNITAPLADGQSAAPLVFNGQVIVAETSDVTIQASIDGSDPLDFDPTNDVATRDLEVSGGTDIFVDSKVRTPSGILLVGDEVQFVINSGYAGSAPGPVTLTDIVPANYEIVSVSSQGSWTCTDPRPTPQTVECNSPGAGNSGGIQSLGSVTVVATVVGGDDDDVTNTASIAFQPGNPFIGTETVTDNNSASDIPATIREPFVDLLAVKTGPNPRLAVVGNNYNYTVRARNIGNANFIGTLTLTDTIPTGLDIRSVTIPAGFSCIVNGVSGVADGTNYTAIPAGSFPLTGGGTYICSREYTAPTGLAANNAQSPAITFNTTVVSAGQINNTLNVSGTDVNGVGIGEPNFGNNSTTFSVTATQGNDSADVLATKRAGLPGGDPAVETNAPTATAGQPYLFELEVKNNGPVNALNVRVIDDFTNLQNGNVAFNSVTYANTPANSCTQGNASSSSRRLTCNIGVVPVCGDAPLPTPTSPAWPACPVITVVAVPGRDANPRTNSFSAISQTTPDANLGNNSDSVTYPFEPRQDLTVRKTAPATLGAGRDLTYVISAQNVPNGLSAAQKRHH